MTNNVNNTNDATSDTTNETECGSRGRRLSRRGFLTVAGAAGLTAVVPEIAEARALKVKRKQTATQPSPVPTTQQNPSSTSTAIAQPKPALVPTTPGILVLITLYGGNDGLNTLIPLDAGPYLQGRGALAYKASETIPLADGLGLHPALSGIKGLWDRKQLAIVRGVGYPSPSRSHFRSQDIWSSATPATYERTGWIGRWYDKAGSDPLGLAAIASSAPRSFTGNTGNGVVVDTITKRTNQPADFVDATRLLNAPNESLGLLGARVRSTGNDLGRVEQVFGPLLATQPPTPIEAATLEPGTNPRRGNVLSDQLNVVARLIKAGSPTRVYAVGLGGFDTHANERANHANLMTILDTALSGFVSVMAADPVGKAVTVMVSSEFGRRVAANGSGGTDHGTAAPVFIAGPAVKGGFYGESPSLTDLDQGDLKFTVDFRSIYSTILSGTLGADPLTGLDKAYPNLGFL
jgi:uncharacterized protein (DUF1501 family)